jgi:hypothetical protein
MTRNLSLISWLTLFNKSSLALSEQLSVILALPLGLKMAIQLVTWHDGEKGLVNYLLSSVCSKMDMYT